MNLGFRTLAQEAKCSVAAESLNKSAKYQTARRRDFAKKTAGLAITALALALAGCSSDGGSGTGTTTAPSDPNYKLMTGNWEFTATPTSSAAPFQSLSGFINERSDNPGVNDFVTAALVATSNGCYASAVNIPLQGGAVGTKVNLTSFMVNGQVLNLVGTKNAASNQITGTYAVSGGCAGGATGTLSGVLYAPLSGTYSGAITTQAPVQNMQLSVSQASQGDGAGRSFLTGSAVFSGIACFSTGTIQTGQAYVIGKTMHAVVQTNDLNGATVTLDGTFDAAASTISVTSLTVSGGSCAERIQPAAIVLSH